MQFRRTNPFIQNLCAGLMAALEPGIYGAVISLGAGGGKPTSATIVYWVTGLFAGAVVSSIGPKWTYVIASFGYPCFVAGLWYYGERGQMWFPILGGVACGIGAALLWTAGGYISMGYPKENEKGIYLAWQWGLCSVGGLIGSAVAFGITMSVSGTDLSVPTSVYIVFIILMLSGCVVALLLIVPPDTVYHDDGSKLTNAKMVSIREALWQQTLILKDWKVLLLCFPMFACESPIMIQATVNAYYCDLHARSLNGLISQIFNILSPFVIGKLLDKTSLGNRIRRGWIGWLVIFVITFSGWIGMIVFLVKHPVNLQSPLSWNDTLFGGWLVVYILLSINASSYQILVQWAISSLTNDALQIARYSGIAKGMVAAGLAVTFGLESAGMSQVSIAVISFVLQAVGLVLLAVALFFVIKPGSIDLIVAADAPKDQLTIHPEKGASVSHMDI